MKKLILVLFVVLGTSSVFGQTGKYTFIDCPDAAAMVRGEINKIRVKNGIPQLNRNSELAEKAEEWNRYMVLNYISETKNSYKHANQGPEKYHCDCSEILHMVYFDHKPSDHEITMALVYGWLADRNRDNGKIMGWMDSPGHAETIKYRDFVFMGASVGLFKTENYWIGIGVVKFTQYGQKVD